MSMHLSDLLVVATDGSMATSPRRPWSAWAWVDQHGRYATGTMRSRSILAIELRAIAEAVTAAPRGTPLLVVTDSKPAAGQIRSVLNFGTIPDRTGRCGAKDTAAALHRIAMHLRNRPVTIEWVKGHAGHRLNDSADRLAHQTRLAQDPATVRALLDRIAAEAATHTPTPAA